MFSRRHCPDCNLVFRVAFIILFYNIIRCVAAVVECDHSRLKFKFLFQKYQIKTILFISDDEKLPDWPKNGGYMNFNDASDEEIDSKARVMESFLSVKQEPRDSIETTTVSVFL